MAQIYSSNGKMIYEITLDDTQTVMNAGHYKVIIERNKPVRMLYNGGTSLNKKAKYIMQLVVDTLA